VDLVEMCPSTGESIDKPRRLDRGFKPNHKYLRGGWRETQTGCNDVMHESDMHTYMDWVLAVCMD